MRVSLHSYLILEKMLEIEPESASNLVQKLRRECFGGLGAFVIQTECTSVKAVPFPAHAEVCGLWLQASDAIGADDALSPVFAHHQHVLEYGDQCQGLFVCVKAECLLAAA
jgi:hypothetical protein